MSEAFSWDPYTPEFYRLQTTGREGEEIIELARSIHDLLNPRSVADIGCGRGLFLKAFEQVGVKEIWGCDGKAVLEAGLLIPESSFRSMDFRELKTGALPGMPDVDVALCLEVLEHLPDFTAVDLLESITLAKPRWIVLSAAHPGQGGTGHINERPPEYWIRLLDELGYSWEFVTGVKILRRWVERIGAVKACPWYWENLRVFRGRP